MIPQKSIKKSRYARGTPGLFKKINHSDGLEPQNRSGRPRQCAYCSINPETKRPGPAVQKPLFGGKFGKFLVELVNTPGCIDEFEFAGEVRVAERRNLHLDQRVLFTVFPGNRILGIYTRAAQKHFVSGNVFEHDKAIIRRMDIFFHNLECSYLFRGANLGRFCFIFKFLIINVSNLVKLGGYCVVWPP
jgi:hypothetical protein